jgi:hypothetical protein
MFKMISFKMISFALRAPRTCTRIRTRNGTRTCTRTHTHP